MALLYPAENVMYVLWKFEEDVNPTELIQAVYRFQQEDGANSIIFSAVVPWYTTATGRKYAIVLYYLYSGDSRERGHIIHKTRTYLKDKFGKEFHSWDESETTPILVWPKDEMSASRYLAIDARVREVGEDNLPCDVNDRAHELGFTQEEVLEYYKLKDTRSPQ